MSEILKENVKLICTLSFYVRLIENIMARYNEKLLNDLCRSSCIKNKKVILMSMIDNQ